MADKIAYDAEMAVLGCVLKDNAMLKKFIVAIDSNYFGNKSNKQLFEAMVKLDSRNIPIDSASVVDCVVETEHKDAEKVKKYVSQLLSIASDIPINADMWIELLRKQYQKREMKTLAKSIMEAADEKSSDSPETLAAKFNAEMTTIMRNETTSGPREFADCLKGLFNMLYNLNGPNKKDYLGIPSGFIDLDKMINGLHKSDLTIIGARPAMGKTAFVLNLATNIALKQNKKVLFFSLEMSTLQLTQRLMSSLTHIMATKFRTGELKPDEWTTLNGLAGSVAGMPLVIDDTANTTPAQIKSKIELIGDVDVVIIDYLSLMKLGYRTEGRVQEISAITRELKLIAKELNVPIIVLSQLNRSVEARGNADHRPQLADLRESGSIEQDADVVIMLYRKNYYKDPNYEPYLVDGVEVQIAEVLVRKNRHGPIGDVKLAYIPEWTMFDNLPEDMEVPDGN